MAKVILEGEVAVRKVQSRRFLAGAVWKNRYCVLGLDNVYTLAIYKSAAAFVVRDQPIDSLRIDNTTKVVNETDNGKKIMHIMNESGGILTVKTFAFDSSEKELEWISGIRAIIERNTAETNEQVPAVPLDPAVSREHTPLTSTVPENADPLLYSGASRSSQVTESPPEHTPSNQSTAIRSADIGLPEQVPSLRALPIRDSKSALQHAASTIEDKKSISQLNSVPLIIENSNGFCVDLASTATRSVSRQPDMSSKPVRPSIFQTKCINSASSAETSPVAVHNVKSRHLSQPVDAALTSDASGSPVLPPRVVNPLAAPSLCNTKTRRAVERVSIFPTAAQSDLSDLGSNPSRGTPGNHCAHGILRRSDRDILPKFSLGLTSDFAASDDSQFRHVQLISAGNTASDGEFKTHDNPERRVEVSEKKPHVHVVRPKIKGIGENFTARAGNSRDAEVKSLSFLNAQLSRSLETERAAEADEIAALRLQVELLSGEIDTIRISNASLEEQNRLMALDRSNLERDLILCKENLQEERRVLTEAVTSDAHVDGHLSKTALVEHRILELEKKVLDQEHAFKIIIEEATEKGATLAQKVSDMRREIEAKEAELLSHQELIEALEHELLELKRIQSLSISDSTDIECRISAELQEEMKNETRRMLFLEQENDRLQRLLFDSQGEVEELMKRIDALQAAPVDSEMDPFVNADDITTVSDPKATGLDADSASAGTVAELASVKKALLEVQDLCKKLSIEISTTQRMLDSERDRNAQLEKEVFDLRTASDRYELQNNNAEEDLTKRNRITTAETSKLISSEGKPETDEKAREELVKLHLKFTEETRVHLTKQFELQKCLDEADLKVKGLQRLLTAAETDMGAEISSLRNKNAELKEVVSTLNSTLTTQRNKQLSIEAAADRLSADFRAKSEEVAYFQDQLDSMEAKHARELAQYKGRALDADTRIDAMILEMSEIRRRCDELEISKKISESQHRLEVHDLSNINASALRDLSDARSIQQRLESAVSDMQSTIANAEKALRTAVEISESRHADLEAELSDKSRKLQFALNLIKSTEADVLHAAAAEGEIVQLKEQIEVLRNEVNTVQREIAAVNETNKALVDELTEQMLISTRRCDEMDEEVRTLQDCAVEAAVARQEAVRVSEKMKKANESLIEIEREKNCMETELRFLREFHSTWSTTMHEMKIEIGALKDENLAYTTQILQNKNELTAKSDELLILSEIHKGVCKEIEELSGVREELKIELHILRGEYDVVCRTNALSEESLRSAKTEAERLQGRVSALEQSVKEWEVERNYCRSENAALIKRLCQAERDLTIASTRETEYAELEDRLKSEHELLNEEVFSLRCELQNQCLAMNSIVTERDLNTEGIKDQMELNRVLNTAKLSLEEDVVDLKAQLQQCNIDFTNVLHETTDSVDILNMCCRQVENLVSCELGCSIVSADVRPDQNCDGQTVHGLRSLSLELQRQVGSLSDAWESICGTVADACLYLLRGRQIHVHDRNSCQLSDTSVIFNDGIASGSTCGVQDELDDCFTHESGRTSISAPFFCDIESCTSAVASLQSMVKMPMEEDSALSKTWPIFSRRMLDVSNTHSASYHSVGMVMLAKSLKEALVWRMQMDVFLNEDRARATELQVEKHLCVESKLRLRLSQLEKEHQAERKEKAQRYDRYNSELKSKSDQAAELAMENEQLKNQNSKLSLELHTVQEEFFLCKQHAAHAIADLQKSELRLARERKLKQEFELLLRRSDMANRKVGIIESAGSVSPLNSECDSVSDENVGDYNASVLDLRKQVAALVNASSRQLATKTVPAEENNSVKAKSDGDYFERILSQVATEKAIQNDDINHADSFDSCRRCAPPTLRERLKLLS